MRKKTATCRLCVTIPVAFYAVLADQASVSGLSMSRLAWLRLKRHRSIIVPTEVTRTLQSIERMLRTGRGLSYADRALIEACLSRIRNFLEVDAQ